MGSQPVEPNPDDAVVRDLRRLAKASPSLSAAEQERLLQQAVGGDGPSRDRLVASQMPMVIRQASARADRGLSLADLVQEGSLGLVEAVRTFAASGEEDFGRFAERHAGEQMDAAIAAEAAAVRDAELLVAAANDYERVEVLLRHELRRDPSAAEISQKLEWNVERTQYVAQVVAEARRRHDEELLAFIDPDAVDTDDLIGGQPD